MDVGVRELRDRLSHHLASVKEGHSITVTDHGRPVARIVPVEGPTKLESSSLTARSPQQRDARAPTPTHQHGWHRQRSGGRAARVILYADTSALVPLVISEPSSPACAELWDAADRVAAARIVYVEARAALAMAERQERVSRRQANAARRAIDDLWVVIDVVELDHELMTTAAQLARTHALRAYDATHCAAAIAVNDPELVAASGDARLLAAWQAESVATRDTNR